MGYNATPPADDGTQVAPNQLNWAKHIDKIGDPLKNYADAINANVFAAFAKVINTDADENNLMNGSLAFGSGELTIAESVGVGSVTATRTSHTIDTEADASADNLDEIKVTGVSDGAILILRAENIARTVTLRHGHTNIFLAGGGNVDLDTIKGLVLQLVAANWRELESFAPPLPRGYLAGLGMSNGSDADHDIDIAVGEARSDQNGANTKVTATLTIAIDASGENGLDTGAVAADTWYHVHTYIKLTDGSTKAVFSLSATAPTLPDSSVSSRRIGSVLTNVTSNIIAFTQLGDEFLWLDPPLDVNVSASATAATGTLTVPTGLKIVALTNVNMTSTDECYVSSLEVNDEAPTEGAGPLLTTRGQDEAAMFRVRTDTSGQIRHREGGATGSIQIATLGWLDRRGRDG